MKSRSKFADLFEIKRPVKPSLKKGDSNTHLNVDKEKESKNKKRLFIRNHNTGSLQKSKYTKNDMEKHGCDTKIPVKQIAEEYERKCLEASQSPKILRRSYSDSGGTTQQINPSDYMKMYNKEIVGLDNHQTKDNHFETLRNVYESSSCNDKWKSPEKETKATSRKLIKSFVEAENEEEQEICRQNLVDEINMQVANMKMDGFIDEDENALIYSENIYSELNSEELEPPNLEPDMSDENLYYSETPTIHGDYQSQSLNDTSYFVDDFSESLGDDLENGAIIAEAYNDDGRELILVQIVLDRKVINLDSTQSIKDAIEDSEFVFYENEGNSLSTKEEIPGLRKIDDKSNVTNVFNNDENQYAIYETIDDFKVIPAINYENIDFTRIRDSGTDKKANKSHMLPLQKTTVAENEEVTNPEEYEVFGGTNNSNRSTIYSVASNENLIDDDNEDDEGISLNNYEVSAYNNMRRETFCDQQGIIRIERVGYPEKSKNINAEESTSGLRRTNSVTSNKRLDYIIDELKVTERKYVDDLRKVVDIYRPYIRSNTPINLLHHQSIIFGNIKKIFKFQKRFLTEIEKCPVSGDDISGVFIDFEFLFDLYPSYLKNKPKADILLRDHSIINMIKQMQEIYEERLDFSAYLLTPLQRLGKYILFLENIEKEMNELQLPVDNTQTALDIIKKVMSQGNDYVAIESIENSPISKSDYGFFIMRETFVILKPRRYESMVFLFSNVIVFTINDEKMSETFNYVDSIRMNDLRIATFENGIIHLTDFTKGKKKHNTVKYTYVLEAKTERIRDSWREAIEKILWEQLRNARENSLKLGGTLGQKYKVRNKSTGSAIFYIDPTTEEIFKET